MHALLYEYRMASGISANLDHLILHDVSAPGREIGRGAYGRVFEVDYAGTLCAAKEIHKLLLQSAEINEFKKLKDDFLHECHIWSTLRHPHIVQFLGMFIFYMHIEITRAALFKI